MVKSIFHDIKIAGISAAVSTKWSSLEELYRTDRKKEAYLKKFTKMTGVKGRYVATPSQTASDLAYAAAEKIILEKNIDRETIGAVIFVTQQPDYFTPATACLLQHRLNLSEDCIAYDVNLGCSGYVYGLQIGASIIRTTNTQRVLILVGDTVLKNKSQTKQKKWFQRKSKLNNSFRYLFGDAAGATLLEKDDMAKKLIIGLKTDGSGYKMIMNPYGHWRHPGKPLQPMMDEVGVFNFSITKAPELINSFFAEEKRCADDYEYLVLHQANLMMMKQIAKRTGFAKEKNLISIDEFGNTSSASIPVTLVKHLGQSDSSRDISCLMCGFGIGLSWGIISANVNIQDIYPLVQTDEFFDDGLSKIKKEN